MLTAVFVKGLGTAVPGPASQSPLSYLELPMRSRLLTATVALPAFGVKATVAQLSGTTMKITTGNTALVITDLQDGFLRPDGVAWSPWSGRVPGCNDQLPFHCQRPDDHRADGHEVPHSEVEGAKLIASPYVQTV